MSIDLNQALEYAVAWAKEVGKIQLSYFRGNDLVYKPNRMCTMW